MTWRASATALLVLLAASACGQEEGGSAEPEPSPSIRTLTPLPPPPSLPPTGEVTAEMRQSSIDASLGRMQVWIANDTAATLTPDAVTYADGRLGDPLPGDRVRAIPSQSERGYPLVLPVQPECAGGASSGTVTVTTTGGRSMRIPVADPTDVVGRFLAGRCQELAAAEVAGLSWAEEVPGAETGVLTLVVRPTGAAGRELLLDSISGTHLFTPVDGATWEPDVVVRGDGRERRLELPVRPARCDPHAFVEGGGATAFKIRLEVDGEPGQILLRMSSAGQLAAILFAKRACGLE